MSKQKPNCIFEYKWSVVDSVGQAVSCIAKGAEAVSIKFEESDILGLSAEDVTKVAEALTNSVNLFGLSLAGCDITTETIKILLEGISTMKNLETLDLSNNPLEDEGAAAVAKFVEDTPSVKHLDLSACGLGSSSEAALIDMIDKNVNLRSLIIDNNPELSSTSVYEIIENCLSKKTIANLSALNTFCKLEMMTELFGTLKRNQSILMIGFPTFYSTKKNRTLHRGSRKVSMDEISKDDLVPFNTNSVERCLIDALRSNYTVVKIYNFNSSNDLNLLLKRNLELMKNEFNDILLNEAVSANEVTEQKIIILGRKDSGKSSLMSALFGSNFIEYSKYFELQLKNKFVVLDKGQGVHYEPKEVTRDFMKNLSIKFGAKILAGRSERTRNEKFHKLSKAVGKRMSSRMSKGRSQKKGRSARDKLTFFRVPDHGGGMQHPAPSGRNTDLGPRHGNSALQSLRNRRKKKDSRYRFDSTNSDPISSRSSKSDSMSMSSQEPEKPTLSPLMRNAQIVDSFSPNLIAKYGNTTESSKVFLKIREISNKINNNISKSSGGGSSTGPIRKTNSMKSALSMVTSLTESTDGKKHSDADKFGPLNDSLIDLNNFIYGIRNDDGVYIITFDLSKLLKYIQVDKEKMIVNNPISNFIKLNLKAIYNWSASNRVMLVGTHCVGPNGNRYSDAELEAVNKLLHKEIRHKFLKRLVRCKTSSEYLFYFPVDSTSGKNIDGLRKKLIDRLTKSAKNFSKENSEVPIKYLRTLDAIALHKNDQNINFMMKEELLEKISSFGFKDVDDMDDLLQFLRKRNDIIMFPDVELLKDFIVLNKAFLYFCIYQLVNRRYITKMFNKKEVVRQLKEEELGRDLMLFKSKKMLSSDLIEFLWRSNNQYLYDKKLQNSIEDYYDTNKAAYLYIIEMMKKLLFLTEWKNPALNNTLAHPIPITRDNMQDLYVESFFLIPSLMKNSVKKDKKSERLKNVKSHSPASSRATPVSTLMRQVIEKNRRENPRKASKLNTTPFKTKRYMLDRNKPILQPLLSQMELSLRNGISYPFHFLAMRKKLVVDYVILGAGSAGSVITNTILKKGKPGVKEGATGWGYSKVRDLMLFKSKKMLSRDLIEFLWRSNNQYLYDKKLQNSIEDYYDTNKAAYLYALTLKNVKSFKEIKSGDKKKEKKDKQATLRLKNKPTSKSAQKARISVRRGQPTINFEEYARSKKKALKKPEAEEEEEKVKDQGKKRNTGSFEGFVHSSRARKQIEGGVRGRGRSKDMFRPGARPKSKQGFELDDLDLEGLEDNKVRTRKSSKAKPVRSESEQPRKNNSKPAEKLKVQSPSRGEGPVKQSTRSSARVGSGKKRRSRSQNNGTKRRPKSSGKQKAEKEAMKKRVRIKHTSLDSSKSNHSPRSHSPASSRATPVSTLMRQVIEKNRRENPRKASKLNTTPFKTKRYMLDRNKPVSVLLDFREGFLPDGFFIRLCGLMYGCVLDEISRQESGFASAVESVELHKNYMKINFDSLVHQVEDEDFGDDSTIASVSEFDSISVMAEAKKHVTANKQVENEKEYLLLCRSANSESVVMVVRDHEHAPVYLKMLSVALALIEGDDGVTDEHSMMFYDLDVSMKVEVKNNKFLPMEMAKDKNFAPWFSKNRLIKNKRHGTMASKALSIRSSLTKLSLEDDDE